MPKTPRPASTPGRRIGSMTLVRERIQTRPATQLGERSRRRPARAVDEARSKIDETARWRSAPVWRTPVRRAKVPKDFSQVSLARYLELLDWTAANCNKTRVGKGSPSTWARDPEPGSGSILLAGVTWCVSSGGCCKRARGHAREVRSGGDPLRTGLVVRPRESARLVFGLKRLAFHLPIREIKGSGRGHRCAAIGLFQ